jgi:RNA polymerase sigma-70 factor (ECF subfamily)
MRLSAYIRLAVPVPVRGSPGEGDAAHATPRVESRMDEAAFRDFYNEIGPSLRRYIRRSCGDPALADDLLQETFYRFLRADLPALEPWQLKAYLYRTAFSLVTDHWRRLEREKRWRLERPIGDAAESIPGSGADGDAMGIFRRLKPREQTLLWLAYVEGFDHREIALALQIRERSVRVLLFRARKKFGTRLQDEGFEPAKGKPNL